MLVSGLILAVVSELVLRRFRPQWALKRSLELLKRRVQPWQEVANSDLQELSASIEGTDWGAPIIYEESDPSSLLNVRADEITASQKAAPSDAQRARWGPDGAKMTALEEQVDAYHGLLDDLRAIARQWRAFEYSLSDEDRLRIAENPLRAHVYARLTGRVLREGELEREIKLVADLPDAITDLTTLRESLVGLERDARAGGLDSEAAKVARTRAQLLKTYVGGDDQEHFAAATAAFADVIIGGKADETPATPAPATARRGPTLGTIALAKELGEPDRIPIPPPPAPLKPDTTFGARIRRNLSLIDVAFFTLSTVLVLATGMSLVYFAKDTFGGLGDYLAIFVWGSTGVAALAFARNVLPGVFAGSSSES